MTESTPSDLFPASKSEEWYTPPKYIGAACEVLGGIDLDPASCATANKTVGAKRYFDLTIDGLTQPWVGRVWINPPYGGKQIAFIDKLLSEYDKGNVTSAILLLKAYGLDAKWFRPLWDHLLCFTNHRINFSSPDIGAGSYPGHSNVFVYLGRDWPRFREVFQRFGIIVSRYDGV